MIADQHPPAERLRLLLDGRLDDRDAHSLTKHLGSCESCLRVADSIWNEVSPLGKPDVEELPPTELRRIERSLFVRVHRTDLAESVAGLGSRGFLLVMLELLKPLLAPFANLRADRRRR